MDSSPSVAPGAQPLSPAMDRVLARIEAMTAEEFDAKLAQHRNGFIATAIRELQASEAPRD